MTARERHDPGDLRHRIVLERPERTPDGLGGAEVEWMPVATVWAAIRPLGERRGLIADQAEERLRLEVTIRHRSDVASGWRVLHGTRTLSVEQAHDPDERGAWLRLLAEEEGR